MIGFLIKGLARDKSRSLFPVLMVSAGVFLAVFLYGWMQGVLSDFVRTSAQFDSGHVKVTTNKYREFQDQMPNDLALIGVSQIMTELEGNFSNMIWTPRVTFGGLLDVPDKYGSTRAQCPVMGMGINLFGGLSPEGLSPETKILNLKKAVVKGAMPAKAKEMLISDELAEKLGLKIGDTVTFLGSTMYGSMANYNFIVAGTVNFGITAMDRGTIIADINDVQAALDMQDAASEILGFAKNMIYDDKEALKTAAAFNAEYFKAGDKFSPVMMTLRQQGGVAEYMDLGKKFGSIIVGIFVLAMSIVLWNSGLMNALRRYGEIGVRLALGESKNAIYGWMIAESVVIGLAGSVIGTALGVAATYYLQVNGVDFTSVMHKSDMLLPNEVRAQVTPVSFVIGFLPGLIAPVIGSIFAGLGIYKRQTAQLFKELEV